MHPLEHRRVITRRSPNDMKTIDDAYKETLGQLKRHVDLAVDLLRLLRFNMEHGQQFVVVCLHTRLIHLAAGCHAAGKDRATPCIPILVRSMWEADVDLDNAVTDDEFFRHMYASFLKEKLRLSLAARPQQGNRFMASVPTALDLPEVTRETQEELDRLTAEKHGPLSIKERARRVNRCDEYDSIYNLLCLEAHNNVRSLESDHVEHRPDGSYQMTLYSEGMTASAVKDLLLAVGLLAASIDKTHRLLETTDPRGTGNLDAWVAERGAIEAIFLDSE